MMGVVPSPLEILWETRGHNRAPANRVTIKLGVPSGKVYGFEIDTSCFNKNHGPAVTAEGTFLDGSHLDANTPVRNTHNAGVWPFPETHLEAKLSHYQSLFSCPSQYISR
ncbi:unnamed protein product [Tuber melanosporum]|uniref:(Perigord truffle) hypothetical protein n=1 Tax=Tuber melanosporum (strain Mel28) TaxID=656061 RepID=D5G6W5_TUBMM|nr:uncharacterized protein GSTUM_00002209001 [Tuber melanosporum]CAZ80258.1 unnamed protein product [Tuber melanosporum]